MLLKILTRYVKFIEIGERISFQRVHKDIEKETDI